MVDISDKITLVRATREEHDTDVFAFMMKYFRVREPITASVGATEEDLQEFFRDLRDHGTHSGYSFIAFNDHEIAGICLNSVIEFDEDVASSAVNFDPMKDFKEDIDNGGYKSANANRIATFVVELERFAPSACGVSKCFKVDVIAVATEYARCGIGQKLLKRSIEEAAAIDCDCVATAATAAASQRLFAKNGFHCAKELPYSCFREGYRPVFENLHDGSVSGKLMVLKLK